jgi:hypothetical protein
VICHHPRVCWPSYRAAHPISSSYYSLFHLNNSFRMAAQIPIASGKGVPDFASSAPPSSVWDRISTWASENKAVVYTIAGVAIVVSGAGVAYYLTDSV